MSFSHFVADEALWASGIERQERDQARARAIAAGMSEDSVRRLTQIAASYPWLRPGVALAASQAGLDDRTVAGIAGHVAAAATADRNGWQAVGTKVPAIPQVYSPRIMKQLENAEADAKFGLGPAMVAGVDEVFPEQKENGVLGFVADVVGKIPGSGTAASAITATADKLSGPFNTAVQAAEMVHPELKPAVRWGVAIQEAQAQELTQSFRRAYQIATADGGSAEAKTLGAATFAGEMTAAGSGIRQHIQGENYLPGSDVGVWLQAAARGESLSTGEGYTIAGETLDRRLANELEYGTIGGHAITVGRALGQGVGFEVDSKPFTMVSGLADLAVVIAADPFDVPLGMAARSVKAANAFRKAGVHGTHARAINPAAVTDFVRSAEGRSIVDIFTRSGPDDFADLWRKTGGQIPAAGLNDLLDAKSADEVTELLYNQLGVSIRTKGAARSVLPAVTPIAAGRESLQQHRLFNIMPSDRIDFDDLDDSIRQLDRFLVNANTPDDVRRGLVNRAARTTWREDRYLLNEEAHRVVERAVRARKLSPHGRKKLEDVFRRYADSTGEARKYDTDLEGKNLPGLQIAAADGELIDAPSALLMSEITQYGRMGNARDIRRLTSQFEPVLNSPLRVPISMALFVQDRIWKPLVLARIAWPVRVISEEQVRMAAAGNTSMIYHPMQAISYMLPRDFGPLKAKGATEITGDVLAEAGAYQRAMSQSRGGIIDAVIRKPAGGWTLARKGDKVFVEAWGDELAELQADPIAREIARMRAGRSKYASLDEIKDAYWDGALSHHRELWAESQRPGQRVRTADPIEGAGPQSADEYIDAVAARVDTKTLGDDDLMTIAATGRVDGELLVDPVTGRISDTARTRLNGVEVDDKFRVKTRNYTDEQVNRWDRGVDWMMSHLMTKPTNFLSRSPSYRQFYWRRVEEIASATDDATRIKLAEAARHANLEDVYKRILRMDSSVPEPTVLRKRIVEVVNESQPAWDDGPTLFHGAQGRIEGDVLDATGGGADTLNLFGPGFYTTDAQHVAASYAGEAAADPFLYEVRFKGDGAPRVIDFDSVPTASERAVWDEAADQLFAGLDNGEIMDIVDANAALRGDDVVADLFDEIVRNGDLTDAERSGLVRELAAELRDMVTAGHTNSSIYERMRTMVAESSRVRGLAVDIGDDLPDEAWRSVEAYQEDMSSALQSESERFLNQHILGEHFDAITHRGGIRVGGLGEHQVHIWLDPENIDITPSAASDELLDLNEELRAATRHTDTILETGDPVNLTVAQIDEIAKGHALDDTKGLLYDLTERSQFFDTNRLLFPFGEAWMEVITRWATLVKENPALVARGRKALTQANEGFFYENEHGDLTFNYPMSGWATKQWTSMFGIGDTPGVPFPMTGRAHGLSVATEILPGAGPVVQMAADRIIPNRPKWDPVRRAIMPFGSSESLTDLIIPPFANKILAGLSGDDQSSIFDVGEDADADRVFGNTVIDSMRYLESTGGYDISTDEGQRKLLEDGTLVAQRMWVMRGVGQFVSPTSPSFDEQIVTNDADLVAVAVVMDAYQEYRDEDPTNAYLRVVEQFGDTILPALVGKSTAVRPGGESLTEGGNDWLKNNERVEKEFPRVWGYFAPSTGEFNYDGYARSFESGARSVISTEEWVREVNDLRGRLEYDARRKAVAEKYPESVPANVREWLSDERRQLKIDYPGYLENEGIEGSTSFEEGVRGIEAALEDDMLRETEAGQAMVKYLGARDKVFAAMRERDEDHADSGDVELSGSLMTAKKWAYLRDSLWQYGEELMSESPDFGNVWDGLLVREVNKEQE